MVTSLTIATRESPLALWQANYVKSALEEAHPSLAVTLRGMTCSTGWKCPFGICGCGPK